MIAPTRATPTKPRRKPKSKQESRHGSDDVFELEALEPATLQQILTEAIESVIDQDFYNREVEAESNDAAFLDGVRTTVHEALKQMNWAQGE